MTDLLWSPSEDKIKKSELFKFCEFLEHNKIVQVNQNYQKLWQWYSNRDHRFSPDFQPVFENGILKCKSLSEKSGGKLTHRNYWFRLPNEIEWEQLAPGITGLEEQFKYILKTYYGSN